uniref:Cyclin N-terminal domain-containing protein n=1 Tax=Caenorhabditis tropicalis TaxID=1561998 RepID=A0A1I7UBN4_9PELO
MLADLPSNQMQKSCNILLEGMVESTTNPTTTLWNTILPMIIQDVEDEELHVGKFSLKTSIVTVSADQPAKRSLFGFKAHQASQSCFFCLSTGTFHKLGGSSKKVNTTEANYFVELSERSEVRSRDGTILDSEQGVNGFGDTPARIVQLIMPYDTPIDMLHNFGEGLCEVIIRELFGRGAPKSGMFHVEIDKLREAINEIVLPSQFSEIENCRNGTDKLAFFRLTLLSVAIRFEILNPHARFAIIAISMLANKMCASGVGPELFDEQLCSAAQWFLQENSNEYLSCKAHVSLKNHY